jgi:hypothetical protein
VSTRPIINSRGLGERRTSLSGMKNGLGPVNERADPVGRKH